MSTDDIKVYRPILDLPMDPTNDAGATTIRAYLKELLTCLWEQEQGFSGKRPFGNSDWQHEVYTALVKGNALAGDEDGNPADYDYADKLVMNAIRAL